MTLSDDTLRLFPEMDGPLLEREASISFVICRLLEQGDSTDLSDLFTSTPEGVVRDVFRDRGGRTIDRRSRAFWELLFDVSPEPDRPEAEALWPL